MSIWACPRCHALEHPGPRRCSCGEMTVRVEVAAPAPRREDAAGVGRDPNYLQTAPCLKKPEYGNGRCHHVDCLLADRNAIAAALSTAERERDDATWSAYRHGYLEGTAYKPPEGSKDTYETLSAVADARASQHVKLRARVPSGGEI